MVSRSVVTAPIVTPSGIAKLNTSSQAEEILVDQNDDSISQSFVFRTSPLKKGPVPTTTDTQLPARHISNDNTLNIAPVRPSSIAIKTSFSIPVLSPGEEDCDSVISDSGLHAAEPSVDTPQFPNSMPTPHRAPLSTEAPAGRKKFAGTFSEEESHLLIFLKEVKKLAWKDLTQQFQVHFPGRKYHTLQTHYSTKLNRRDRSQDPLSLILPSCFASEAVIDWAAVHEANSGPIGLGQVNREATGLQQPAYERQPSDAPWARPAVQDTFQEYSSANESIAPRARPKRAVPPKNYTWPKRSRHAQADDEMEDDSFGYLESIEVEIQSGSEEPAEVLSPAPEKAIPVDNDPLDIDFEQEDAALALSGKRLPYLAWSQRCLMQNVPDTHEWDQLCSRDWQGSIIHVDFRPAEIEVVMRAIHTSFAFPQRSRNSSRRKQLQIALRDVTEPKLMRLAHGLRRHLSARDQQSIEAFLKDARVGKTRIISPKIERLAAARPNKQHSSDQKTSTPSIIRQRELGLQSWRGWRTSSRPLSYQLKDNLQDTLGPAFSYTGAASDVHAVAWSADGQCFAAGAICVDDPHSMQYNRPNNLLHGDVSYKVIYELAEHSIERPRTESGPNSTHAMYASQDPNLYKTVSSVAFSPNGKFMFSGGYDNHVCIWGMKTDGSQPELIIAMKHKAEIDMMAVNRTGLLATASKKGDNRAIKVIAIPEDDPTNFHKQNLGSERATNRPDHKILPTALQFSPRHENLLLGGFGANARIDGRDMNGDICLWDVNAPKDREQLHVHGSGKNVFDLAFHPRHAWFAVGCVAGQNVNRGTRSIIRLYDENGVDNSNCMKYGMRMELECKALDMNDVVWCPGDDNLVAAGCTSGRAYVWDVRWPDRFLRELAHGSSLMPLDDYIDREITDTGIRFLSWGDNATRLYTGSSDGVVKVWNVVRSEEETFVKDLVATDSGIMSGAFSSDKSKLILGEVNGTVNVLEVGREDCSVRDAEKLKYIPYKEAPGEISQPIEAHSADSGIASAAALLQSGSMMTIPIGGLPIRQAVQGDNYAGPFDNGVDAPFLREQALEFQYNLSRIPGPQCTIASCADAVSKITSEETGDSGRSTDRIPDELRQQYKALGSTVTALPGKSSCTSCGRPARPSDTPSNLALCERCSFVCFRCSAPSPLQSATDTFSCATCKRAWDIGALGYECIKESHSRADASSVPSLRGYDKELLRAKMLADEQLEENASYGDEMNALTDYYFGLAIDRPESPPL
ncbi:WD40 repeat-like protein [Lentithecium fluviatile CBS 122367]|uniref:WD40 repeat-like protein n=1 Tax=Lentithecium fluviatile CBS 122367 TaxID=1168545 RepID=A0A6G1JDZ4_9PLEO|nr:WD40 repeat-like protein [Lentithecium fluviatile CBS 122367]